MDLSTTYMGLKLKNPLVAGAGPLTADIDFIRRLGGLRRRGRRAALAV